jgi:hypothetical protein
MPMKINILHGITNPVVHQFEAATRSPPLPFTVPSGQGWRIGSDEREPGEEDRLGW